VLYRRPWSNTIHPGWSIFLYIGPVAFSWVTSSLSVCPCPFGVDAPPSVPFGKLFLGKSLPLRILCLSDRPGCFGFASLSVCRVASGLRICHLGYGVTCCHPNFVYGGLPLLWPMLRSSRSQPFGPKGPAAAGGWAVTAWNRSWRRMRCLRLVCLGGLLAQRATNRRRPCRFRFLPPVHLLGGGG